MECLSPRWKVPRYGTGLSNSQSTFYACTLTYSSAQRNPSFVHPPYHACPFFFCQSTLIATCRLSRATETSWRCVSPRPLDLCFSLFLPPLLCKPNAISLISPFAEHFHRIGQAATLRAARGSTNVEVFARDEIQPSVHARESFHATDDNLETRDEFEEGDSESGISARDDLGAAIFARKGEKVPMPPFCPAAAAESVLQKACQECILINLMLALLHTMCLLLWRKRPLYQIFWQRSQMRMPSMGWQSDHAALQDSLCLDSQTP